MKRTEQAEKIQAATPAYYVAHQGGAAVMRERRLVEETRRSVTFVERDVTTQGEPQGAWETRKIGHACARRFTEDTPAAALAHAARMAQGRVEKLEADLAAAIDWRGLVDGLRGVE